MKYYIVCPENFVTGGTELAHQLAYEINENGQFASMYYVDRTATTHLPVDSETPDKFKKYCNTHVTDINEVDAEENVIVVPEALTNWAFVFSKAKICIWWMSVDNCYYRNDIDYIKKLDERSVYHLIQSYYAADYLRKHGIDEDKLIWLSDYIGDAYLKFILPAEFRKDIILFNPKKGLEYVMPLFDKCTFAQWKPLINMTEEEMILNMQMAKLYVDFGNHPGKDRIPREAAACGCLVITNKKGSAAFTEDVPINDEYKFDDPLDYDVITQKIHDSLEDYVNRFEQFEDYRNMIRNEKEFFKEDAKGFMNLFNKG